MNWISVRCITRNMREPGKARMENVDARKRTYVSSRLLLLHDLKPVSTGARTRNCSVHTDGVGGTPPRPANTGPRALQGHRPATLLKRGPQANAAPGTKDRDWGVMAEAPSSDPPATTDDGAELFERAAQKNASEFMPPKAKDERNVQKELDPMKFGPRERQCRSTQPASGIELSTGRLPRAPM